MKKLPLLFVVFALIGWSTNILANSPDQKTVSETVQEKVININIAKANDFVRLKGIGQKKAQAIVQYRKINGPYGSLHDLLKVKGVGQKILYDNKTILAL
jgi:competence protein ComEA